MRNEETVTITKEQLKDAILYGYDYADSLDIEDDPEDPFDYVDWYSAVTDETWRRLCDT